MVSIKNDALIIGTGAIGAAGANVAFQHKKEIAKIVNPVVDATIKAGKASIKGETYKKAATSAAETLKKAGKASVKGETYKKAANKVKNLGKKALKKETYAKIGEAIKENSKSIWDKVAAFGKKTNWKTVGKYAAIGAGIAAAVVAVKEAIGLFKD